MLLLVFTSKKPKTKSPLIFHFFGFAPLVTKKSNTNPQEAHKENLPALIHFRKEDVTLVPSSPVSIYQNFIEMSNGLQRFKKNKYNPYRKQILFPDAVFKPRSETKQHRGLVISLCIQPSAQNSIVSGLCGITSLR